MSRCNYVICVLLLLLVVVFSSKSTNAQQRREIIIKQANQMRNLRVDGQEIRRLIGDVIIVHEDVTMKCDSAYEYVGRNHFDAFSNVVVIQENSTLYGDTLRFNGNTKVGRVRGEIVRLVEEDLTLTTRYLDFNTQHNTVYYFNGGVIRTPDSHFSSERGTYFSNEKRYVFSGQVAYKDEDILLNTDSLEYHTDSEFIYFFGPTRIYAEENYLYSEKGWHNRRSEQSEFHINTYIDNGEQLLFGNRVFYDRLNGYAKIDGNGLVIDTTQNLLLYGQEIEYFEKTEYAKVRIDPLAIAISEQGDSLFYRADLIIGESVKDSIQTDSTLFRLLKGDRNVRFYRADVQGLCDSMVFHGQDSILHMYKNPIIWNEQHQLTANNINIHFKNENINRMDFYGSSFVCSQEDSTRFNQISGREMIGYFNNGSLYRLDVNGNGETVYFLRDEGRISAVNRAESSNLTINIRDNEVVSIMFRDKPTATLFPIDQAELQDVMLRGFAWHNERRPQSKMDIIPKGLDPNFYMSIQKNANQHRLKRIEPAKSINEIIIEDYKPSIIKPIENDIIQITPKSTTPARKLNSAGVN